MSDTLIFPGLGLELTLNPIALQITDTWSIHWYGVIMAAAFLAAVTYVFRKVNVFGLDENRVIDVLVAAVIGGIVGARTYYVIFSWDTYRGDIMSVFRIWEGGIAMYGSIIGGVIVGSIVCRIRGVKLLPMFDLAAGGLLIGQAIGRWGNFVNMEAFGGNTSLPWGMTSNTISNYLAWTQASLAEIGVHVDPAMPVHPTFLYESLWNLIGFIIIFKYTSKRRFDGEIALFYIGWYGLGRFVIEGLRTDSLMLGSVRISQMVALCCVIYSIAAIAIIYARIKKIGNGNPDYLKLYVLTEESRAVLEGTYYTKKIAAQVAERAFLRRRTVSRIRASVWAKRELHRGGRTSMRPLCRMKTKSR